MLRRGSKTAVSYKPEKKKRRKKKMKKMLYKPHQKHSSLSHIDRDKIYTSGIPYCDLIPAPHNACLILKLQALIVCGFKHCMKEAAENQNSPHAIPIRTRGFSNPHQC